MRTSTIPSYLFTQYADDVDLQSLVDAQNKISQEYVDWFNSINLPIYTKLSGQLLDWVGQGVYGVPRPTLQTSIATAKGPLNTYAFNSGIPFNGMTKAVATGALVSDDIYQRVLTWMFYKGDGQEFSIEWLKKRIIRFIFGDNGRDVKIGALDGVNIISSVPDVLIRIFATPGSSYHHLFDSSIDVDGSILYGILPTDTYLYDSTGSLLVDSTGSPLTSGYPPIDQADIELCSVLKTAIESGICPLPFQYTYSVVIS
jgi:hypothetical protein